MVMYNQSKGAPDNNNMMAMVPSTSSGDSACAYAELSSVDYNKQEVIKYHLSLPSSGINDMPTPPTSFNNVSVPTAGRNNQATYNKNFIRELNKPVPSMIITGVKRPREVNIETINPRAFSKKKNGDLFSKREFLPPPIIEEPLFESLFDETLLNNLDTISTLEENLDLSFPQLLCTTRTASSASRATAC